MFASITSSVSLERGAPNSTCYIYSALLIISVLLTFYLTYSLKICNDSWEPISLSYHSYCYKLFLLSSSSFFLCSRPLHLLLSSSETVNNFYPSFIVLPQRYLQSVIMFLLSLFHISSFPQILLLAFGDFFFFSLYISLGSSVPSKESQIMPDIPGAVACGRGDM